MSTYFEKNIDQNKKHWYLFDAKDQVVGRLASQIAKILSGKHKRNFTPHVVTGDFVVVVNAEKVALTGKKWTDKIYYQHSGYVSGLKAITAKDMLAKHPEEILRRAVRGMLPKNKLMKDKLRMLKIYSGPDHPHLAQNPGVAAKEARK